MFSFENNIQSQTNSHQLPNKKHKGFIPARLLIDHLNYSVVVGEEQNVFIHQEIPPNV